MKFILVLILVFNNEPSVKTIGTFKHMNECFEERELMVEKLGRPIENYQAVCIITKDYRGKI